MNASPSFLDPAVKTCPYPYYSGLRQNSAVSYQPDLDMYFVSTYDLITEVLKNTSLFSSKGPPEAKGARTKVNYSAKADAIVDERGFGRGVPTLANNDPPSHTVYRKIVSFTLRASRIRQMTDYVARIVEEALAPLPAEGVIDIVQTLAIPLPMYVIADQIGVAREDFNKFKAWGDALLNHYRPPRPEAELIQDAELVVEAHQYMAKRMRERREHPVDDIISELVTVKVEDGRLMTDHEVVSILQQLLVAGNETTTNGIGNGLLMLAEDQALQSTLRDDPEQIPQFVEECLRMEAPVQGLVRTTTADTVLGGVAIPKGKTVMLLYASANRDETHFPNSGCVDLSRKNAGDHLAFGNGRHHCVGSELARVEMRVAFDRFLRHFAHFELAVPRDSLQLIPMFTNRGYHAIPLRIRRQA